MVPFPWSTTWLYHHQSASEGRTRKEKTAKPKYCRMQRMLTTNTSTMECWLLRCYAKYINHTNVLTCFLMASSRACSTCSLNLSFKLLRLASVSSLGYKTDMDIFTALADLPSSPPSVVLVCWPPLGILTYLNSLNKSSICILHFFQSSLI